LQVCNGKIRAEKGGALERIEIAAVYEVVAGLIERVWFFAPE
jgi:hypothetical protein